MPKVHEEPISRLCQVNRGPMITGSGHAVTEIERVAPLDAQPLLPTARI